MTPPSVEAIYNAMDHLAAFVPAGATCPWGCPTDAHGTGKEIPDHGEPFVVYGFFGFTGHCLYVGQTSDLGYRCYQHNNAAHLYHAKEVRILATAETRGEAQRLEREHIRSLDPLCNVKHSRLNGEHGRKQPA